MSKASTRKRTRLTLLLGAVTTVAFGGIFGIVAHRAAEAPSATVYAAVVATAAPTTSPQSSVASTATQATAVTSVPAATAAATPVPTAAAHAQTKAS